MQIFCWYSLRLICLINFVFILSLSWSPASAQSIGFKQAVVETATDPAVLKFYRAQDYQSFWTGNTSAERARFKALTAAFSNSYVHGLPSKKFSLKLLLSKAKAVRSDRSLGNLDVELTNEFLRYARAVQSGVLVPSTVDVEIVRQVNFRDPYKTLTSLKNSNADEFFKTLPPQSSEYARLVKEKLRLKHIVLAGGWGDLTSTLTLEPGAKGAKVVALRNRLANMGYLRNTLSAVYGNSLETAVRRFQFNNGLMITGIANTLTLEQINNSAAERLMSVLVSMERERWLNQELGDRHILVNLTDFKTKIIDHGKVTFQTNSVIGAHDENRRSPEFSDIMEHIIVNPSWYVPRSIIINEYLPLLQGNSEAIDFIELRDDLGNVVERAGIDFNSFDKDTFPFSMRQPPGTSNALGLIKFMFPNINNIYLHDTPAKKLFSREVRAFSHGCIRLAEPFEFAYALLAEQNSDPELVIQEALNYHEEVKIDLQNQVPIHIIYRTAVTLPAGGLQFRRDIYGRDAKIWQALELEGVVLIDGTG